jgi:hypothetical protein
MADRKRIDEKHKPIATVTFPIRFSISGTKEFREKLDEYLLKRNIGVSTFFRELIFEEWKVNTLDELENEREYKDFLKEAKRLFMNATPFRVTTKQQRFIDNISDWFNERSKSKFRGENDKT